MERFGDLKCGDRGLFSAEVQATRLENNIAVLLSRTGLAFDT